MSLSLAVRGGLQRLKTVTVAPRSLRENGCWLWVGGRGWAAWRGEPWREAAHPWQGHAPSRNSLPLGLTLLRRWAGGWPSPADPGHGVEGGWEAAVGLQTPRSADRGLVPVAPGLGSPSAGAGPCGRCRPADHGRSPLGLVPGALGLHLREFT